MDKVGGKVVAYSVDYGQRHAREMQAAKDICKLNDIEHRIMHLNGMMTGMLVGDSQEVPNKSYAELEPGISPTYVSFRNGLMLARLTAEAQSYTMNLDHEMNSDDPTAKFDVSDSVWIYFGAHAEDAENWAYPDCTPEFAGAMANAIYIGTYRTVRLLTPFNYSSKTDIIKKGAELNVPYELTWSCYKGEEKHCGVCPTCRARKEAFTLAGVVDPTAYAA